MNKIREFIESANNSQQSDYRTPKVTSEIDKGIDHKYYNHGMIIANITRKNKYDITPGSTLSPNSQVDAKYKMTPRGRDFDPRLLCLPDKPDITSKKKFLATRANRDAISKADNLSSNTLRVSE